MNSKKIFIILLILFSIFFLKKNVLAIEKDKNKELKNQIELLENQEISIDKKDSFDEGETNSKANNRQDKEGYEDESNEKIDSFSQNNKVKGNRDKAIEFCEEISKNDSVKRIERSNSSNSQAYTIVLNSSISDFRKIIKDMDKTGFNILINKIRYDKIKNVDEYSILVNIFWK